MDDKRDRMDQGPQGVRLLGGIMVDWLTTPDGRIAAAGVLFVLIWAIKSLPFVRSRILTTKRAKLAASALVAMAPAALMLADSSVPARDAWLFAISTWLGAMGLQGGSKALFGSTGQASPVDADGDSEPTSGEDEGNDEDGDEQLDDEPSEGDEDTAQ